MAVKQRLTRMLAGIEHALLRAKVSGDMGRLRESRQALREAEALSRKGLPAASYGEYGEVYEGLSLAWERLAAGGAEAREIAGLCRELLQYLIIKTQKEDCFKKEMVFLPYKCSMWDSLESIWRAAAADEEHCLPYVVPIPYCDLNPDGSPAVWHCERDRFPADVPTLAWQDVDLEDMKPDAIFIHNPYDEQNRVTSVESRYYSGELRSHTGLLVYVPYYTTTGGMMEGQALCPVYKNVDYIVVQSEKLRRFFDPSVPLEKIVALGSPKFDKVLRLCQNPPAPPSAWREKMAGKKVYFYNTSLGGMLGNTEAFLKKMRYVFDCFKGKPDACLLWRPHPLMDSTFESMRKLFQPEYEQLKAYYKENEIGIFDDTPEIEPTIALSDAYVGDSATSVTALFGLAGKPMFILNNLIHTAPQGDDWRGEIVKGFTLESKDWMITQGNKLYHAPNHDYHYQFYCDLADYAGGYYYSCVLELKGKVYAFPANAQDILVIGDRRIERRIPLERCMERAGAFRGPVHIGDYVFLMPVQYPAILRFDLNTEKIDYIRGLNGANVAKHPVTDEWIVGGLAIWQDLLLMASPLSQQVVALHSRTLETQTLVAGNRDNRCGCLAMLPDGDDFWMLPYEGRVVTRWNPKTGGFREYDAFPEGFACHHYPYGYPCEERPFTGCLADGEYVYLTPYWGNKFVRLHKETGVAEAWDAPFAADIYGRSGYFFAGSAGGFGYLPDNMDEIVYWDAPNRQWYTYDRASKAFAKIDVAFDKAELDRHADGFRESSEWFQYACDENAFNSLEDFIAGRITGSPHDRARQIRAFEKVAAYPDGTSGEHIYRFAMEKLAAKER